MTEAEALSALSEIARVELEWEGELTAQTTLVHALELDSIRMLQLLVAVEDHFEICLDEGDEQGLETAGDLVRLLLGRLGA